MRWSVKYVLAAGIAAGLAACAPLRDKPTGYSKVDPVWANRYGYQDKRIDDDEYSVTVTGNRLTSKERAAKIALRRAAFLTQEQGGSHFVIVNQKAAVLAAEELISVSFPLGGMFVGVPVSERTRNEPTVVLIIRVLRPQTSIPPDALSAREVLDSLTNGIEE